MVLVSHPIAAREYIVSLILRSRVGEDKTNGTAFININCYSSTNLVEWDYEGALLTQTASGDIGPGRIIERPKIIFNKSTNKYVMWMHIDSAAYSEAKIGVATGDTVCGKYTYLGNERPLGFQSRDSGTYVDDDGKGYLLTEDVCHNRALHPSTLLKCSQRQNGLRINLLSDDYTKIINNTYVFAEKYESPALIKKDGVYFMFASRLTGWNPNDNYYSTATSLSGPWSAWKFFATGGTNTYASQTTFVLPVGDGFVYLGDRWVPPPNLIRSTYIWLPLSISGTTASMASKTNFILDPVTGVTTTGPSENIYEGENATLSAGATVVACTSCSGGQAAGYIGGSSGGTATFSNIYSSVNTKTTVRIKYKNGDSTMRFAGISVNGGTTQNVAFIQNGTEISTSVVHLDLKTGSNVVKISGINGGFGPDVDRLLVPQS